jgi:hypothetical protein
MCQKVLVGGHEKLTAESVADGQPVHCLPGTLNAFRVVEGE